MNAPEKIPSVRTRLRAVTHDIHQALHHAAPFAAIADGSATCGSYGALLVFLHRFHGAMAPLCERGAVALGVPDLVASHAARIAALQADLAHLELAPVQTVPAQAAGAGFCAGVLYTVQGSTLGGKVIFGQLDALLPGAEGRGFFKGAAGDSRDWQALCAALEGWDGALAELEAGAMFAFAEFCRMLNGTCH